MDALKHIEVELKFPLLNPGELIEKLKLIATLQKEKVFQKDSYYIPLHRNFLDKKPVSEWLRLRETKTNFSLNYKNWHNADGEKTISCDEFETKIENLSAIKKMFENLNFKHIVIVEKTRDIWHYKGAEIAIDDVKDLGFFIEIEAKGDFDNIENAKKHLYEILKELCANVGEQDFEGYPYKLLKLNGLL